MDYKKLANLKTSEWFNVKNISADIAEIRIDGVIGASFFEDGLEAKKFIDEFNKISAKTVNLHINSPGGSVYEGFAIYNAISASKNKTVHVFVDGIAASIASVIAMAGDTITMPENTYLMIHNPWSFFMGNADQLRVYASELESLGDKIAKIYADRSGAKIEDIKELLKGKDGADGTFIDAQTALDMKLCTAVTENKKAAAFIGADIFDNLPESLQKINSANQKRSLEDSLRDAGYSAAQAKTIASGKAQLATRDESEAVNSKSEMQEIIDQLKQEFSTEKGIQK